LNRKLKIFLMAAGVVITPVLLSPLPHFNPPLSTVVEAADSSLLGARIADDGQWRFHPAPLPVKFEKALLTSEDRWFRYHPGVNPVSIIRALANNLKQGKIVSGGSTITMQVARIAGGNKERTYSNKLIEILSAVKLEIFRSKTEILSMYAANAPFGGNTVGLEAASWRYTGKSSSSMSWSEAAALAILPNSPGLVFPGRNQETLRQKRDRLLRKLYENNCFDSLTLILALDEPVPGLPHPLPLKAPHLTDYFFKTCKGETSITTIDPDLQERATEIINRHQKTLSANRINNTACLILEVSTGNVLAYVGNSTDSTGSHDADVDIIRSLRSTGSILKPFLYAAMQQSGKLLPNSLVADIPTRFPGFSPKNFDQSFSGAVGARFALAQSLNIPAVRMLQQYDPERFLELLGRTGFTTFDKSADHYGLSLILGGGETSLWELAGAYASLSRVLNNYLSERNYFLEDYHEPLLLSDRHDKNLKTEDPSPPLSASSIWLTYEALQKVNRPESEAGWQYFSSSPDIAWKTGTSFGFRDGWAVGTTPQKVIAVWVGNATGEGRPGLTGITAAAPILFDLVNLTGTGRWFDTPYEDLTIIKACSLSGFRAGPDCPETVEISAGINGLRSEICPYHRVVHLDRTERHQVTSDCEAPEFIRNVPWFVLPPAMEYFYRQKHPEYKILPPAAPGCRTTSIPAMEFIYPTSGLKIFIPRDQTGNRTRIIAEVAHRNPSKKIFWHLDEIYLATTRVLHQVELSAPPGSHQLTAVDEDGNSVRVGFEVLK
jgi:penicillin-binding protein 1C